MKALTLTQPWATLVAIGAKHIETRSWKTNYRGSLAIHAAKGFPAWARSICASDPFMDALFGRAVDRLPLGAVVAVCELVDCRHIVGHFSQRMVIKANETLPPDQPERAFGDYTEGRFAWRLENVEALDEPILMKGALGLWEWDEKAARARRARKDKNE